jgi:cell division protein FtsZ
LISSLASEAGEAPAEDFVRVETPRRSQTSATEEKIAPPPRPEPVTEEQPQPLISVLPDEEPEPAMASAPEPRPLMPEEAMPPSENFPPLPEAIAEAPIEQEEKIEPELPAQPEPPRIIPPKKKTAAAAAPNYAAPKILPKSEPGKGKREKVAKQETLQFEPVTRGRFEKSEPTIVEGQDLDVPTFLRKNVRVK